VSAKEGHSDNVVLVAWSPNGKYLLSSGKDHVVAVWDVVNPEPKPQTLNPQPSTLNPKH